MKMNLKRWGIVLTLTFIFALIIFLVGFSLVKSNNTIKLNDYDEKITISENKKYGKNIMEINTKQDFNYFDFKIQNSIDKNINYLLQNNVYEFENPLVIMNPYCTNDLAFNLYFKNNMFNDLSYKISVEDKSVPPFSKKAKNHKLDNGYYAYQITGLVKNKINYIELTLKNKLGFKKKVTIKINLLDSKYTKLDNPLVLQKDLESKEEELDDGLYLINTRFKKTGTEMSFYDKNGIKRAALVALDTVQFRSFFLDDLIIYPLEKNKIISIDSLGKVHKIYDLGNYRIHHNYNFNKDRKTLVLLANDVNDKQRGDKIITLDLDTSLVKKIIDFGDLLPDMKDKALQFQDNIKKDFEQAQKETDGKVKYNFDWFHVNSVDCVGKDDLIVSSRELSTIVYVQNAYTKPQIKYLIADPIIYKGSKYESLVLDKKSDFLSQAGQHSINYTKKNKNSYYITMYNNAFGDAVSRPDIDWKKIDDGKHKNSNIYVYLVNERKNSYELVKSFPVQYNATQSNVALYKDNYIVTSSSNNYFSEFNKDGKRLAYFKYGLPNCKAQLSAVYKYSFDDFWFK